MRSQKAAFEGMEESFSDSENKTISLFINKKRMIKSRNVFSFAVLLGAKMIDICEISLNLNGPQDCFNGFVNNNKKIQQLKSFLCVFCVYIHVCVCVSVSVHVCKRARV